MKKLYYISAVIVLALLVSPLAISQHYAKNWLFGDFGLEFKSDTVVVRHDYAPHESRGMGIISDKNGNLLCYTDGFDIWNRNHTVMPHGNDVLLVAGSPKIHESIIVPKPGSETQYYVFTVDAFNGQAASGLYYSVVDLNMDNGLGDVTVKGKKILDRTTNKITAVYHHNGHDVWIITHQNNTNSYYAYLLSETGLTETPAISAVGKSHASSFSGQLKASPDGTKIACSYDASLTAEGFTLFDFNNSTGRLSNPLLFSMPVTYRGCDGLEFSPDAKKIFVYQTGSTGESGLYQFDISSGTYNGINNSRILIFQDRDNGLLQMQLAPNAKIYFTKGGGQDSGTKYLGVIENPNDWGNACKVKELGFYLDGSSAFVASTPNFIQNYFFKTSFTFDNACSGNLTEFRIANESGLDSVRWDFGQGSSSIDRHPLFSYSLKGKYTVTLLAHYPTKTDTIQKQITINPSPRFDLGKDTTVCYSSELSVAEGFKSYRWNTGETTRSIIITKPGGYKLTVENEYGCQTSDSVYLNVKALPVIELPDSIQIGTLDSIPVNPGIFKSYLWNTGETTSSVYIKKEGWYSVTVENETGCYATKSFCVYINKQPTDDPEGWKLLNPLPSAFAGLDICFLNSQVGYILNSSQILGTPDGGTTWKVLMGVSSGKRMAFKNNYGYIIGNYGAIYKSTYMGVGWNKLNTGIPDILTGISVISKDTVFVTGTNKLYTSFDGGKNWNTLDVTSDNITDSYFTSSSVGHVGCTNGSVFKTVDGGKTWSLKSSTNSSSSNINKMYFVDSNTGFISRGYMTEILKTTDAGETWKVIKSSSDEIYTFLFLDSQTGFMAGEYGVIFKTTNGGSTWDWISPQNGRYGGADINGIFFIDSMTGFAVGLSGEIMKTTDGGKTWKGYAVTYNNIKQLKFISNTTAYGLVGNSFIKTTDGGNTWTNMGAPVLTGNTTQFDFINENTGYCIAGGDINSSAGVAQVFKTTDGAKTWTVTNNGLEIFYDNLYSIKFVDVNTGFVSGGYNQNNTFKTTNGGTTWTQINNYSFSQMKFINPLIGYGRSYSKIYKTMNGGITWTVLLTPAVFSGIASFDFTDENNGYFVGSSGAEVYKTIDGGTTWQKINAPYNYYINVKFYSPNVGYITEDYGKTYQTSNGGVSWIQINKPYGVTGIELYGNEIFAFGGRGVIMKKKIEYKTVVISLDAATGITNKSVTLSGNVTSNNELIKHVRFEYGIGALTNIVDAQPDSVQPNASLNQSLNLTDLKPNKTYNFRLTATANGVQYSSEMHQFTTLPDYTISMYYVYNILSNEADISGNVISNASDITDIEFQYGTDTTFTFKTAAVPDFVSGGTGKSINAHLSALKSSTRYYARIKARYNDSVIYSLPAIFNTGNEYVISMYNPYITGNTATFNVYIRANKDTIRNIQLEYGITREYKNQVNITAQIDKGTYNYVSAQITGLDSAAVYYYRIKANMGTEIIYSAENILNLQRSIVMIPIEPKQLSDSLIILNGLVNSNGILLSNIRFQYGQTMNFGDSIIGTPNYAYTYGTSLVSSTLSHITQNVKYYARISATNGTTRYYSDIFNFALFSAGLDSLNADSGVSIYPNPATDYMLIKSIKPVKKVEIYDSFGLVFLTAENESKINISKLFKGIYFVRILMGDKYVTKKMIKN